MLGGRTGRPIRRRQEPDANGAGGNGLTVTVCTEYRDRDRAREESLSLRSTCLSTSHQLSVPGQVWRWRTPVQSQSRSRRMVPYGEKAGAGRFVSLVYAFDARWLLWQREGDCRDGSSTPKKERETSHRWAGAALDRLQTSSLYSVETLIKGTQRPWAIDNNSSTV